MKLVLLLCLGMMVLSGGAVAQDADKATRNQADGKTIVTPGAATPGGGFPLYGNAFAEVMNAADPALAIGAFGLVK